MTPVKTLHDGARYEAEAIRSCIDNQVQDALLTHGFEEDGAASPGFAITPLPTAKLPNQAFIDAVEQVAQRDDMDVNSLLSNSLDYEDTDQTVCIHIDDVGVKFQKKSQAAKATKNKTVKDTAFYIEHAGQVYRYCEPDLDSALRFILGFLLINNLLHLRLRFFTDGERQLKKRIFEFFSWHQDISLILDWKHAHKKPYNLLSMATYKKYKQPILDHVRKLLWHGQAQAAIDYLSNLPANLGAAG